MHLFSYSFDLCFLTLHMDILLADECRPARQWFRAGHYISIKPVSFLPLGPNPKMVIIWAFSSYQNRFYYGYVSVCGVVWGLFVLSGETGIPRFSAQTLSTYSHTPYSVLKKHSRFLICAIVRSYPYATSCKLSRSYFLNTISLLDRRPGRSRWWILCNKPIHIVLLYPVDINLLPITRHNV